MDALKSQVANVFSVFGSYGVSILAFVKQADFVGILTAMIGAFLTYEMAMETKSNGLIKFEEARKLRLENDYKEAQMKKDNVDANPS